MITDPAAILVVLAAVVYVATRLEERFKLAKSLGSAFLGILMGILLSNTGVVPGESTTYDFLGGPAVSVGIALILFTVDVRTVFSAGPTMLAAFGIGALGTVVGAITGGLLWSGMVGPETWKLTGQFTGTYIGGGVNYAAVGEALDTNPDVFTAALAADVIITAFWMAACLMVPVALARWNPKRDRAPAHRPVDPTRGGAGDTGSTSAQSGELDPHTSTSVAAHDDSSDDSQTLERALFASNRSIKLTDIAALVALGIGTVWGSQQIGDLLPVIPSVLWLTTIALLLAQVPAVRRIAGSAVIGNYLILLFLASNGARSVVANIVALGPGVFYFAATTVAVHGIVIFGLGRAAGINLGTSAVASQANIGGPASAMALATARGYTEKLLPGVAVGLLGYAVGNYAGYFIAQIMRAILAG